SELRTIARCFLAGSRSHAGKPPRTRLRHAIPHSNFLPFAGARSGSQEVTGGARSQRKVQAAHRDGDYSGKHILSGRRVSPEVLAKARRRVLPLLINLTIPKQRRPGRDARSFLFQESDLFLREKWRRGWDSNPR